MSQGMSKAAEKYNILCFIAAILTEIMHVGRSQNSVFISLGMRVEDDARKLYFVLKWLHQSDWKLTAAGTDVGTRMLSLHANCSETRIQHLPSLCLDCPPHRCGHRGLLIMKVSQILPGPAILLSDAAHPVYCSYDWSNHFIILFLQCHCYTTSKANNKKRIEFQSVRAKDTGKYAV